MSLTTYLAAYQGAQVDSGGPRQIGIATTTNFVTFAKQALILSPTAGWSAAQLSDPCLVDDGSGTLKLYYAGTTALYDKLNDTAANQIGLATSTDDGATWVASASNPIITFGAAATWNHGDIRYPHVVYDPDDANPARRYKMWACGSDTSSTNPRSVGYFYSADGTSWTASSANPVISVPGGVRGLAAVLSSGTWHLFFGHVVTEWQDGAVENIDLRAATFTDPEGTYSVTASALLSVPATYDSGTGTYATLHSLTATVAIGDSHLFIDDTTEFAVGEQIYLVGTDGGIGVANITGIPSGTRINFTPPVIRPFESYMKKVCVGYIIPASIRNVGGEWVIFGSVGGQFFNQPDTFASFENSRPFARAIAFKSSSLTSGWTIDTNRGVLLSLGTQTSVFTNSDSGFDKDESCALSVCLVGGASPAFDPTVFHTPFTDVQHVCADSSRIVVIADASDDVTADHVSIDVAVFDLTGILLNVWSYPTVTGALGQYTGSCLDGTSVYFQYEDGDSYFAKVNLADGTLTNLFTVADIDAQVPSAPFGTGVGRGIVEKDGDLIIAGTYGLARVQQDGTLVWWGDVTDPFSHGYGSQEYRGLAHSGHGSVWACLDTSIADEWSYDGVLLRNQTIVEVAIQAWAVLGGRTGWVNGGFLS